MQMTLFNRPTFWPKAPMHVLVKEIYDMVPLAESEDVDLDESGEEGVAAVRNNGRIANSSKNRKRNRVDHAADSS